MSGKESKESLKIPEPEKKEKVLLVCNKCGYREEVGDILEAMETIEKGKICPKCGHKIGCGKIEKLNS